MSPASFHLFCPRCGAQQAAAPTGNVFTCPQCGFRLYFSASVAVAVFIRRGDGQMLFIVRGKDPGKGRLAPPGGFIDLGETAEAAVHREVREEVGIELGQLKFLCSQPNQYLYGGVQYPVLDLFFTADAVSDAAPKALDDVTEVRWMHPAEVAPEALAFVSMQEAFRVLRCGS